MYQGHWNLPFALQLKAEGGVGEEKGWWQRKRKNILAVLAQYFCSAESVLVANVNWDTLLIKGPVLYFLFSFLF